MHGWLAVDYIVSHYDLKMRQACRLVKQTRSTQYRRSVKDPRHDLRARMHEIARTRVRYGYRRIHVLLKRDGWKLGKNQMYRLYREEQLQLRSKLPKRRKMVVAGVPNCRPQSYMPPIPQHATPADAGGLWHDQLWFAIIHAPDSSACDTCRRERTPA